MYFTQFFIPITNMGNKIAYLFTQMFEKGLLFTLNDRNIIGAYST